MPSVSLVWGINPHNPDFIMEYDLTADKAWFILEDDRRSDSGCPASMWKSVCRGMNKPFTFDEEDNLADVGL